MFQKKNEDNIYKTYILSICLVIALLISGLFLGMSLRTRSLIMDELLSSARAKFEMIVAMRLWNARYGGVYVEKKEGVASNPYLTNPDIITDDRRVFTMRNPAMMTREISDLIGTDRDFTFRITSTKLVNPDNKPNSFELSALDQFEKGSREVYEVTDQEGGKYFSYMGPLPVNESCLPCHAGQGYRVGDVRGGISVSFNIDGVYAKMRMNTIFVFIFSSAVLGLFLIVFWLLTTRLFARLTEARRKIEEIATVDDLTRVFNRRYLNMQLASEQERSKRLQKNLGCLLIDIDNFKSINDTYGHVVGDGVLIEVATRINTVIRSYDILGRFGGEEFLVILPETGGEEASGLGERVRLEIRTKPIRNIPVTVSIGVATMRIGQETMDEFLARTDRMLYKAKHAGKDCVMSEEG